MSSMCLSRSDQRERCLTPDSAVNHFIDNEAQVDEEDGRTGRKRKMVRRPIYRLVIQCH